MPSSWLALPLLLSFPASIFAVTIDCKHVRVDKQSFDLSSLKGPKSVHWLRHTDPTISNTTFTIDLCSPLERHRDVPKEDECPGGTRVCGIETDYNRADNIETVRKVIPVAGDYTTSHGRPLDPQWTRLKGGASHEDAEREGLRVELQGGKYPFSSRRGRAQKAIVEFICDRELTGNEGFEDVEERLRRRADEDNDEDDRLPDMDKGKSLQFVSYKCVGDNCDEEGRGTDVLRLLWKTKYACEGAKDEAPSDGGRTQGSWGFFTWFIIVLFLLVAAYIIFGSWLNYNRYGARGWDLIPHGDTIRDLPYVIKDWGSNVANSVRGGGNRGGYSAV